MEKKRPDVIKRNKENKGKNSPCWKNGTRYPKGYKVINSPNHPNKDKQGYVAEHRLIMEKYLGRYLTRKEIVHHINGNRRDNRLNNLMLFANNSQHHKYHSHAWNFLVQNNLINKYHKWLNKGN